MWKFLGRRKRWLVQILPLLAFGGCVTSAQMQDFATSEFARLVADYFGRALSLLVQATSPTSVQ